MTAQMMKNPAPDTDMVVMGYVSGAFGVRGWLKIHAETEYADSLFDYPEWWLGQPGQWQRYTFLDGAVQPKAVVAQLEGINDRDQAFALRGSLIAIPRAALPAAEEGEFYWADLIGLSVINREGQTLGKVTRLFETGANDVLVLEDSEQQEIMIPFVAVYVLEVDIQAGTIVVDWQADY